MVCWLVWLPLSRHVCIPWALSSPMSVKAATVLAIHLLHADIQSGMQVCAGWLEIKGIDDDRGVTGPGCVWLSIWNHFEHLNL